MAVNFLAKYFDLKRNIDTLNKYIQLKKIKVIFQNITYSTEILHGDRWRSKITIAKAKGKSFNIWNNKMLKVNFCSKSANVTAIFNERAEILPRDYH